jgi:tRNA pseudouridine38-40 synthase
MRFKVTISYDGSNFNGFQKQKNYRSVENELELALFKMHKHEVKVVGAGRTDKDVHALNQVFHFDSDLNINELGVKRGLNALLPDDIYVREVELVDENFHARFSAKEKVYEYLINMGEYNPIEAKYVYQLNKELDLDRVKEASKLFIGEHDFYNFCGYQENKVKNYVRTIKEIKIIKNKERLTIRIKGNGFIRYMVRMIVAILIEIGLNRKDNSFIIQRLDSKEKKRSNYKVSGVGLYLAKIYY